MPLITNSTPTIDLHRDLHNFHVNVEMFGAVGDGVTDDTSAIQAAIDASNAAGGGIVFVPPGTYIYTLITLKSNVWLVGAGKSSVLKFKTGTNTDDALAGNAISHAGMRDLTVDYNHTNNTSSTTGMRIELSSYVTIERCTFLDAKGFAISFAGDDNDRNTHINVIGNNVLNPRTSPNDMLLVVSDHGIVARNRVVGINANIALVLYESDHLTAYGNVIELASGSGHTGIGILSCRYANVYGNKVAGAANGIGIGLYTEHDNPSPVASERNSVHGNSLYNLGVGIQIMDTGYDRVVSNRIENTTNAIEFPASAQPDAGNVLVADNDLRYNNTTAIDNTGAASTNLLLQRNWTDGDGVGAVASAGTIALPYGEEIVLVTGTTTITSITAVGHSGRRVTLIFAGVLTFTDGSNLRLAGNFVTTADDTITLVCDGSNWYEVSRSVV